MATRDYLQLQCEGAGPLGWRHGGVRAVNKRAHECKVGDGLNVAAAHVHSASGRLDRQWAWSRAVESWPRKLLTRRADASSH